MSKRATDTFFVVVTTNADPYTFPYTARTSRAAALAAYVETFDNPMHGRQLLNAGRVRVVRVRATWEVKP